MMGLVLVAFIKENIENNEVRIILDYYFSKEKRSKGKKYNPNP